MPRKPIPCAECGELMRPGSASLPEGQAKHNRCRVTHGETRYRRQGCRCDVCKAGSAKQQRQFLRKYRERTGKHYRSNYPRYADGWITTLRRNAIYVRDRWTCQICGQPVDRELNGTSGRMAATLDHIRPRSKGGSDASDNLRLAHRSCNSAKKDKWNDEKFSLSA